MKRSRHFLLLGQRQFGDAAVGRLAGYLYTSTSRQAIRSRVEARVRSIP